MLFDHKLSSSYILFRKMTLIFNIIYEPPYLFYYYYYYYFFLFLFNKLHSNHQTTRPYQSLIFLFLLFVLVSIKIPSFIILIAFENFKKIFFLLLAKPIVCTINTKY